MSADPEKIEKIRMVSEALAKVLVNKISVRISVVF